MVVKNDETLNGLSFDENVIMGKKTAFIVIVKLSPKKAFIRANNDINVPVAVSDLQIDEE